jgi:pimeloyl-ACP methyl ester carboxylesterase
MKGCIELVTTEDKLILQGMVCRPDESVANGVTVIHVHGSYGNFYENFFLAPMADACQKLGATFVSINTRGRDYLADLKSRQPDRYTSTRIGGIREVFQESTKDIAAWVEWARAHGSGAVILQGHSLGAMKVTHYLGHYPTACDGLVLVSPPDNIGLQRAAVGGHYDSYIELARTSAASDPDKLMPEEAYSDPITVRAYLALFGTPTDTGMFTYEDQTLMNQSSLPRVLTPILATFGTVGEAIVSDLSTCRAALEHCVSSPRLLQVSIIDGANHNYHFREGALATTIGQWIEAHF